jgi:antitoxin component of RelBE/YafQ-DinJ toxin-antitoxin module
MKKQEKIITIRINAELKNKFNQKAENNSMTLSARIKFLMMMDIENKILIKKEI